MLWQLFIAIFVPFIPVEPTVTRGIHPSKYRLIFECDGFETPFEFTRCLVKENNDILYGAWRWMRVFYAETMAGRQLAEKDA